MRRAPTSAHVLVDLGLLKADSLLARMKVRLANRRVVQVADEAARFDITILNGALRDRLLPLLVLGHECEGDGGQLEGVVNAR